ncbi:hypothetical protein NLJ89_g1803 [Agrocybe chaxingu]|uniref:Uncharacterized protein n=1 Tax=Agrocybe chaxingu TaxID=84603 RepID=A0A9W8TCR9_9AGAR|nr:hypothetical protein NLJ89_g1803 [Agrocybe chaxingu]
MELFSGTNHAHVQNSTFKMVQTHHNDNSVQNVNVIIAANIDDLGKLLNLEQLKQALKRALTPETEGQTPVESLDSEDEPVNSTLPSSVPPPAPSAPLGSQQQVWREKLTFTIRTRIDRKDRRLGKSVSLVLTLTPAGSQDGKPWQPIVWKILHFEKAARVSRNVTWFNRKRSAGFCMVKEGSDGRIKPEELMIPVKAGNMATLQSEGSRRSSADALTGEDEEAEPDTDNHTLTEEALPPLLNTNTFGSIDPTKPDEFRPVVDLGLIKPNKQDLFVCGPPKMLQAYVLLQADSQERQPMKIAKTSSALFTEPVDLMTLEKGEFLLYSTLGGQIVLAKEG